MYQIRKKKKENALHFEKRDRSRPGVTGLEKPDNHIKKNPTDKYNVSN